MKSYQLNYPANIIFGNNTWQQLPELIPQNAKIMLVSGKSAVSSGLTGKLMKSLANFAIVDACGLTLPEPPLENVDKLIEIGRKEKATAIIALGGGSTIDAAKAAAAIIPLKGWTEDYFSSKSLIKNKGLFFIALPTTAGTGAEITNNAVLTDKTKKVKKSIRHPSMVADIAIIDPQLTLSMPPGLTAASGFDALTQAIESFTSSSANAASRALAKSAVVKIMHSLLDAYKDGSNLIYRENMAEGSLLSAMAFSQSGLGAVHGLAHPIGSLLGLAHGLTCSILLSPVMEWNSKVCGDHYRELGQACGLNDQQEFIENICELRNIMKIPTNFNKLGLKEADFPFILANCRSKSMSCNPREMSDEEIIEFLEPLL